LSEPAKLLLTATEAARVLSVSPRTLWSMTASGELPVVRVRRSVRYSVDALREWIASNQTMHGGTL